MKSYKKELWFNTTKKIEFINITGKVQETINESGVKEGLILVNPMHITAAVYVNDAESGLIEDYEKWLEELAPYHGDYKHNLTGEDNAHAHLKRQLMAHQVVHAITNGKLDLGPWEQIYYAEFDGQRKKRVLVKIIGE